MTLGHYSSMVLFASAAALVGGCIYVGESRPERQVVETFGGNPDILGTYLARGRQQWWNGREFRPGDAYLADLFRTEQNSPQCDTVTFKRSSDASIVVVFEAGGRQVSSLQFSHQNGNSDRGATSSSATYTTTPQWTALRLKRYPSPGSEEITEKAELLLALDTTGRLNVVETTDATMMTGIGLPLIPAEGKSVTTYVFYPAPGQNNHGSE